VTHLDAAGLDAALAHGDVRDGMRAKLVAARAALGGGVARVQVAAWSGPDTLVRLALGDGGTTIAAAAMPSFSTPRVLETPAGAEALT
jgi:acetylglutamate kinase